MKIVFAVFGSLGDMHPMNALGIELKKRGHTVIFAAMEFYREKIELLAPMPSASDTIATLVKPRPRASRRAANRRSCRNCSTGCSVRTSRQASLT